MDLDISNKAMSPMSQFGIQFNKNSFGLTAAAPLQVATLPSNQSVSYSLPLTFGGAVEKMEPLDTLQVAVKNNLKGLRNNIILGCVKKFPNLENN